MTLLEGVKIAERIVAVLSPMCAQIDIAGSIRRARPNVNDIDIVLIPDGDRWPEILECCAARAQVIRSGPSLAEIRLKNGVQVDLFLAVARRKDLFVETPSSWGTVLLCRTGSKEHNIKLVQAAEKMGLKWKTNVGICQVNPETDEVRKILASETEEEIFDCLGMPWIPPVGREV